MSLPQPRPDESGLAFLRRICQVGEDGGFSAPIAELLGMSVVSVDEGRVVFELTPGERHYNPIGSVHAGIAMTLLDSAMGSAVHSTLPPGGGYTTVDIALHFVRALRADTGPVRAEGRLVHAGRRMATAEGFLRDEAGVLYAHGTCTCMVFPPPA